MSSMSKSIPQTRIEYIKSINGEIFLTHTEVPAGLGGRGIGSQFVENIAGH